MPPFEAGHTANVGKTFNAARVKRIMRRKEREERIAKEEASLPDELKSSPTKNYEKQIANILANQSKGVPFAPGHIKVPGSGGRKKRTGSIKSKIVYELEKKTSTDALHIARRLINMAKAGDLRAIELVMDRVDGKVPSTIAGDKDNPLTIIVEPVIASRYSTNANPIPNHNLPRPA